jgi:hypothetical protein
MDIDLLPVDGNAVTCGMLKREHYWESLGIDVRHFDDGYLMEAEVFACFICGRDKMKKPWVPKVIVEEAPLIRLLFLAGYQASDPEIQALNMKKVKR